MSVRLLLIKQVSAYVVTVLLSLLPPPRTETCEDVFKAVHVSRKNGYLVTLSTENIPQNISFSELVKNFEDMKV